MLEQVLGLAQLCASLSLTASEKIFRFSSFIIDEMVVDIERVHLAHPVHPSQAPHARKQDGGRGQPQRDRDHVKPGAQPSKAQHGAGKPRGESAKQSGGKPGQPKSSVSVSALSADPAVDEDAVKIDCYLSVVSTVSSPIPPSQRDKHNKVFLVDSGATHHCELSPAQAREMCG